MEDYLTVICLAALVCIADLVHRILKFLIVKINHHIDLKKDMEMIEQWGLDADDGLRIECENGPVNYDPKTGEITPCHRLAVHHGEADREQ